MSTAAIPAPGTPEAAAAAAAAAAATPDPVALQKKIDDLTAEANENKRAAEFWHGKATAAPAVPAAPAKEEADDVDLLEVITTKGVKGLDEVMTKRGYVRAADVDKRVDEKATAIVQQQKLYEQYPDLRKTDSEFFKATALEYGALVKKGVSETVAMEMAAGATELKWMREGKIKTPAETKAEKEKERKARAAASAGDGGNRSAAGDENDEELTDEQKRIARAMGITEEAYAKRAKAGVAMKGIK